MDGKRDNSLDKLYGQNYYKQYEQGFLVDSRSDHKRILELCHFEQSSRVLKIGCGYGVLLRKINCINKTGIESNAYAVSKCEELGIKVLHDVDIDRRLNFTDNSFDFVVMNEVIEHLKNPKRVVEESYRILSSGGKLVLTTPSKNIFVRNLDPTHFSEMSNKQLRLLLESTGFKIINHEVNGINFIDFILRISVYSVARYLRNKSLKQKQEPVYINEVQDKFNNSFVAKKLSKFRSNLLWFGTQQLIIGIKQ